MFRLPDDIIYHILEFFIPPSYKLLDWLKPYAHKLDWKLLSKNPNNKEPDPFYSGNYLITAVRHMITMNEYKTVMEITKESTTKQYASPDNTSTIWQNTVKGIT